MARKEPHLIIGCQEWCSLPDLGIPAIKVRADSGAKTSCLHAFYVRPFERDGRTWVRFEVHPIQKNKRVRIVCEEPVVDRRAVRSSTGDAQQRYVVRTKFKIKGESWPIEVTLTNRDSMGYRMLLGREAMQGRMLIDPGDSFRLGRISRRKLSEHYGNIL